jgi:hypothetical protein
MCSLVLVVLLVMAGVGGTVAVVLTLKDDVNERRGIIGKGNLSHKDHLFSYNSNQTSLRVTRIPVSMMRHYADMYLISEALVSRSGASRGLYPIAQRDFGLFEVINPSHILNFLKNLVSTLIMIICIQAACVYGSLKRDSLCNFSQASRGLCLYATKARVKA